MEILEIPLTFMFSLLQIALALIGKIAIPVITVALCAIVVKRIWKGKTPSATIKGEE